MDDLKGRVAVITGAASGIGLGMARTFAAHGAKLVLADVEAGPLEAARGELERTGAAVIAQQTDVSDRDAVLQLAARASDEFGKVHILCNNAGVSGPAMLPLWETRPSDWQWVLGVNLMGVVHGVQAFVPGMLEHGERGYVVNTASIMGLTAGGGSIYAVSKHAVVRLSEGLNQDLRLRRARIGVSVLCPGLVATRIVESARNRPQHLQPDAPMPNIEGLEARRAMALKFFAESGMPPETVGEIVLEGMRERTFYILTHPQHQGEIEQRFQAISTRSAPPVRAPER